MSLSDTFTDLLKTGADVWAQKELAAAGLKSASNTANTGSTATGSPEKIADVNASVSPVTGPQVNLPADSSSPNIVIAGLTFNKGFLTLSVVAFIGYVLLKGAK